MRAVLDFGLESNMVEVNFISVEMVNFLHIASSFFGMILKGGEGKMVNFLHMGGEGGEKFG